MGFINIDGRNSPRRGSVSRFVREMRHLGHTRASYRCEMHIDQLTLRVPDTTMVQAIWFKGSVKSLTQKSKTLHRLSWTCAWDECVVLPEVEVYMTSDGRVKDAETCVQIVSADDSRRVHGEAKIDIGKISQMPEQSFRSTVKLSRCLDPTGCIVIRIALKPVWSDARGSVNADWKEVGGALLASRSGDDPTRFRRSLESHQQLRRTRDEFPDVLSLEGPSPKSMITRSPGSLVSDPVWPPLVGVLQNDKMIDEANASKQLIQCYEGVMSENRALKHKLRQAVSERNALSKTVMSGILDEYNYDAMNKHELIRRLQRFESAAVNKPIISDLEEELIKTKVKLAEVETEKEQQIEAARKDARELRLRLDTLNARKRH